MQCKKCGAILLDTDRFCTSCGERIVDINPTYNNNDNNQQFQNYNNVNNYQSNQVYNNPNYYQQVPQQQVQQQQQFSQQPINQPNNNKKNKTLPIVLGIVGGLVGLFVIGIVVVIFLSSRGDKMVCTSKEGNITIRYNKNGLTGYSASGMTYKFEEQKDYARQIGVDAYLKEFNSWFIKNTTGTCTIKGNVVNSENTPPNNNNNGSSTTPSNAMVIGDDNFGYIYVPTDWIRFHDTDAPTELQYTYKGVFIVTMNVIDTELSAKECASNLMYNMKMSGEVTDVNGATVKIGRNKEYTAYQVYMYYPSSSKYLVTYLLEAEDGKIHYLALEGPVEYNGIKITDFLPVPESFSLKK